MSKISEEKKELLQREILGILYQNYPKMYFTSDLSELMIRDDEFVLDLLKDLKKRNLVKCLEEGRSGKIKRKWGMSKEIYQRYKKIGY
ncbi:hypothetical protein HY498_03270 [Candidatus Woesearchaeota archaeon]|nr:hypothetical protein [Candidatus Woesearchaeota archaeon]